MGAISVTPEELKSQSQIYLTAREEIETAVQKVHTTNEKIHEEWQGAAFDSYLNQYNELYKNVQQFENLLEQINQQLNKYADTVAERDAQDAQSFGF